MHRSAHQNGLGRGLAALAQIRCPASGRLLDLRRAWPRRPGHLQLDYADAQASVAGQWFADTERLKVVAEETAAVADGVSCHPELGVLLQRRGADRRLRALAEVLAEEATTLVVHRPERRAVVRRSRADTTTYVKLVRPGRALPAMASLPGLRVPAMVDAEPRRGTVEYAQLAGHSLHDVLGDARSACIATDTVSQAFRGAGRAVRALHACPVPPEMNRHLPADEASVSARWVDHAVAHGVLDDELVIAAGDAQQRLARELDRLPSTALSLVHRDLHDKQVVVAGRDDIGLLDLDTLAAGDPAVDVANLLVHLELRAVQGHCGEDVARQAGDAFVDGYGPDAALLRRLGAYATASRLRLACVYAFRPPWAQVPAAMLASV